MPGGVRRWVGGLLSAVLLLSLAAAAPQSSFVGPADVVYRYDAAGRLQVVSDPWAGELAYYRHDPAGNLLGVERDSTVPGGSWRAAGQAGPAPVVAQVAQVAQVAPVVARPAGNLLTDGTHTYTWNARGQLTAVDGPTSASFDYDPFGRRVAVTADGETTRYIHDGDNVAQQLLPDGSTATYLTGPGLDEIFARTVDGITHTYRPCMCFG